MATLYKPDGFKWSQQYKIYHNSTIERPAGVMIKGRRMAHVGPGLSDFGFSWSFSTKEHWHLAVNNTFDEALAWVQKASVEDQEVWWDGEPPVKSYSAFVEKHLRGL